MKKQARGDVTKRQFGRDMSLPDYHTFTSHQMEKVHNANMLRHFIFSRRNIEATLRVNQVRGNT